MNKKQLNELLKAFLEEEKKKGRKERALIYLRSRIPKYFVYLKESGVSIYAGLKEARGYQGWLIDTGRRDGHKYSTRTIAAYMVAVTCFYEHLKDTGVVYTNPFREIRKIRVEKKLPDNIPGIEELNLLLEDLEDFEREKNLRDRITAYRVHVIGELMYATGLRIYEVAELRERDIDFRGEMIHLAEAKGSEVRKVLLTGYAKDLLEIYVNRIRPLVMTERNNERGALLFGAKWNSLSRVVNRVLQKRARLLKLGEFTSHGFRHCLGTHLLKNGCHIRYIQAILGHKALRSTEIYTRVDKEDLKRVMEACHPRKGFARIGGEEKSE